MYRFRFTNTFLGSYYPLTKRNLLLKKKVKKTLQIIAANRSHPSLRNHKAQTRNYGLRWSVSVDKKIRIIYDFPHNNSTVIALFDIGTHEVYI